MYFTYIHIIFIIFWIVVFSLLTYLIIKQTRKKIAFFSILFLFLGLLCICTISCVLIDNYTKIVKISNIKHTKILMNESMQFSGTITNTGGFYITACKLHIRLINSASRLNALKPELFNQTGGFWENFFRTRKTFEFNAISQDFLIGEKLDKNESRVFSVSIRYPTTITNPKINYNVSCY